MANYEHNGVIFHGLDFYLTYIFLLITLFIDICSVHHVILYILLIDHLFTKYTLCNPTHFIILIHFVRNISLLPYVKESN